jgi:hypothetical protein
MRTTEHCDSNDRGVFVAGNLSRFTKTVCLAALFTAFNIMALGAFAQSPEDLKRSIEAPTVEAPKNVPDANADASSAAGPTIYVTDAQGHLATVTLGTYAVHIIGSEGVVLTDIGFDPKNGELYGLSFSSFYRVNAKTGKATFIGNLGISDANALVFDGQGVAYTEGVNSSELYTIDVSTGRVKAVGSTSPYKSAGDLTFYNSGLVLSGYTGSLTSTTPDTLVLLNPSNGKVLAWSKLDIANLFGIVCTAKDTLYGFAGTSVYQLFPGQTEVSKRSVLLKSLSGKGLAKIYGAAYDGYFLY